MTNTEKAVVGAGAVVVVLLGYLMFKTERKEVLPNGGVAAPSKFVSGMYAYMRSMSTPVQVDDVKGPGQYAVTLLDPRLERGDKFGAVVYETDLAGPFLTKAQLVAYMRKEGILT